MPKQTNRVEQSAICAQCWQHITNAITAVCQLTAPLRAQDVERLTTQHPQLSISEQRLQRPCRESADCQITAQACDAWIEAWRTAIQQ